MKGDRDASIRAAAIGVTAAIAVVAIGFGFVFLPALEAQTKLQGVWDTICSAAGIIRTAPPAEALPAATRGSQVVVTQDMMGSANARSIGEGATLALRCTMCHGARGLSEADTPNLAGQYPVVVYKQLQDYKSGARASAVMTPLVAGLSEQDMRDLAAYYAYLPRMAGGRSAVPMPMPKIVESGAPLRNIPPCGACHGGPENKPGGAWLEGQPYAYLHAQLTAFAKGTRRNDISEQMRNVARRMTPAEIEAATRYYAGQP